MKNSSELQCNSKICGALRIRCVRRTANWPILWFAAFWMPVSSFQFAVCCSPFPGFTICHTRAWMTSDISPTSCWSVITCRGSGAQRNGGRGEEVSTCNNAQQCFALVRPIIPGRWMDERQACWELTSFRLAYTLSRCLNPSGPAPLLLRPSANRHYANLFADNVSRKHKNARRGGTSSSSSNVL